jgi:hypothetical protein
MARTKKKDIPKPHEPYRVEFETMRMPWDTSREFSVIKSDTPDSFNGSVHIRKYKVTVEMVDEPIEVIQARIQELWDNCDNHHQWQPLQYMAACYGMPELSHETRKKGWK